MIAIFKREFKAYFQNVIGWLFLAAVLAVYGIYYFAYNLVDGYPYIYIPLQSVTVILLIGIPILTMRSLSEERRNKTDQLTLTAPISVGKIVVGKYLAMVAVYTIEIVFVIISALILSRFGVLPFGESAVAIFGFWLFGCTYLSIGLLISSLTESMVISAVLTFLVLFLTYMMSGICSLISSTGNIITTILSAFDVYTHFANFLSGVIYLSSIIYFVSVTCLMLFLTCQSIQKRRWSVSRNSVSTGVFSTGFIAVGVVLTVFVNLLGGQIPATVDTIDCSYNKYYDISDTTEEILADLDTDITMYVYVAESSANTVLDTTLELYASMSKHITVEYVDPSANPTFYEQYTDTAPTENSVIVVSDLRYKVVDYNDIYETSLDYSTYEYTYAWDAEGELTSAVEYVTLESDTMPVVYEITGHDEMSIGSDFEEALSKANIELQELTLLNEESVPEDASVIIINSPTTDFNEADAQKVIDYLQAGGKAIITSYYASQGLTNFESILAAYGVTQVEGIVAENDANYYYYAGGQFYLFPEIESTDYSSGLTSSNLLFYLAQAYTYEAPSDDADEAVESTEDADATETVEEEGTEAEEEETYDITYTELLTTSDSAVSKTDYNNITTYEYEDGDVEGPLVLGLAVEQETSGGETTQIVVVGSPTFMYDYYSEIVSGSHVTLFTNIIEEFIGDTELTTVSIASKSIALDYLTVSGTAIGFIGVGIMIVVPLALLAAGIVIWALRRRK
ncbi:MAG: Gldg family protein [Clostridiales bacterium]|nr:Gldg family protein [Clostridiales bacterium]